LPHLLAHPSNDMPGSEGVAGTIVTRKLMNSRMSNASCMARMYGGQPLATPVSF